MSCKEREPHIMALLDDELEAAERAALNDHMIRCANCRENHDQLARTLAVLDQVSFAEPGDAVLKDLWRSPVDRFERWAGVALIAGGYAALIGYALYAAVSEDGPALPRIAIAALVIGALLVFLSVLRERLRTYQNDPYREVER